MQLLLKEYSGYIFDAETSFHLDTNLEMTHHFSPRLRLGNLSKTYQLNLISLTLIEIPVSIFCADQAFE